MTETIVTANPATAEMARRFFQDVALPVVAALCGMSAIAAAQAAPPALVQPAGNPGYHVGSRAVLGGDGGWDYLTPDTAAHRMYITRGTHVRW